MEMLSGEPVPRGKVHSVTVVVCTKGRPDLLEQCVEALFRQTYPDFDVLVVDNAAAAGTRGICERWPVSWIHVPVPGLTRARNAGVRAARGDLVAFIDDDGVPEPGWLEAMVEDFSDPCIAAVSGKVRYMKALPGTRSMSEEESIEDPPRARNRFDSTTHGWFALACFGGIGDGGNMMFRRSVFGSAITFDERLGRGRILECADEHVAFASLIAAGYRIAHNPASVVRHPAPATPEVRKARRLRDLRLSIAYVLFLWQEFASHRGDIARFLARAVAKRLHWKRTPRIGGVEVTRLEALSAMAEGIGLFKRARREWSGAAAGAWQAGPGLPPVARQISDLR